MKGQGTFRRMLSAVVAAVGMAHVLPRAKLAPDITDPTARQAEEVRRKRRHSRWRGRKPRHTQPRKDWPVIFWGDPKRNCPKPLSRKALKRIAPHHPWLLRAK